MATLTIFPNTGGSIDITCQRAGKSAPRLVGGTFTSANGANRSTVRGQAKVIPVVSAKVDTATEALIQAAAFNGQQIACSGDVLGGLQTLCTIDQVTSNMVPGSSPQLWEMSFTVNEVNASTVLLKYAPGDTITGETFTGPAGRTYTDANGVIQTAGSNVKRDAHYVSGVRTLRIEGGSRTNLLLRSAEFDNAVWAKTGVTVTPNAVTAPDGTLSADKVEASLTTGSVMTQTATVNATACTYSIFVKKGSAAQDGNGFLVRNGTTATVLLWVTIDYDTGVVSYVTGSTGATLTALTGSSAGWYRLTMTVTSGITSGDSITVYAVFATGAQTLGEYAYAWGAQLETGSFATSYIATTSAAVTLAGESYVLPFNYPPQEMTAYFDALQNVSITSGTNFDCFRVGGPTATPYFLARIDGSTNRSSVQYNTGTAYTATETTAVTFGQRVEQRAVLQDDGGLISGVSINGAAEITASAAGPASSLVSAWGDVLVSVGKSSQPGCFALRSFKIVAGARSLAELRSA